jgi:hypothetical protein
LRSSFGRCEGGGIANCYSYPLRLQVIFPYSVKRYAGVSDNAFLGSSKLLLFPFGGTFPGNILFPFGGTFPGNCELFFFPFGGTFPGNCELFLFPVGEAFLGNIKQFLFAFDDSVVCSSKRFLVGFRSSNCDIWTTAPGQRLRNFDEYNCLRC